MADQFTIRPAQGIWVVRAGGAVLGESENALELTEAGKSPVIYFPREDIATEFLDASDTRAQRPGIGEASHFSIVTKSTTLKDSVWSYETPDAAASQIAGHLAFQTGDLVTVERL